MKSLSLCRHSLTVSVSCCFEKNSTFFLIRIHVITLIKSSPDIELALRDAEIRTGPINIK